ncbi:MAG: hypothetical protein IPG58_19205 [Acidobacteria bacterium]|nr:hypothetical protein [Acidobacteriota bacterium]
MNRSGVLKLIFIAAAFAGASLAFYSSRIGRLERVEASTINETTIAAGSDPAKSRAAFSESVKVFFSARCSNCHPGGEGPTQGDTMTPHSMEIKRGPDGRGIGEQKCTTCHQDINLDGDGLPPGAPNWHMPGEANKMAFQGISAGQLCRNLKDPLKNGGRKSAKDAVHHIATDPLVLWAWTPGNGRTTPPMSHADFIKKMNEWVDNGAACPE